MNETQSQEEQALRARVAQVRSKLQGLDGELGAVDREVEDLAPQRMHHELLGQACTALDRLGELGAASLFWGEGVDPARAARQLGGARARLDAFQSQLDALDQRRSAILGRIDEQNQALELLGVDLYYAREDEERRKLEWVVERDIGPMPQRPSVMAWARGGEEDWRWRRALAASLLIGILVGAALPMIDLPMPSPFQPEDVPKRLAQLVREERAKPLPPPPPVEERPREDQSTEQKPKPLPETRPEEHLPPQEVPALAAEEPPKKAVEKAGLLAFRDAFASLARDTAAPRLGSEARLSSADDASKGITTRSMLTTNAPGSSGGINLASLSRGLGGGGAGGSGALQGVQVGRATSSLGGIGEGDRPVARAGAGATRTDEEIQIVFDRYKAALYRLYNRELRRDPTLRGQMILRLTIEPDGSVSMCVLHASDMNAPDLSDQVVARVRTINFGAKEDVQALTIVYPIDFLPAA